MSSNELKIAVFLFLECKVIFGSTLVRIPLRDVCQSVSRTVKVKEFVQFPDKMFVEMSVGIEIESGVLDQGWEESLFTSLVVVSLYLPPSSSIRFFNNSTTYFSSQSEKRERHRVRVRV